jgi:hypothetical protein
VLKGKILGSEKRKKYILRAALAIRQRGENKQT